jgi:hypothetical protein
MKEPLYMYLHLGQDVIVSQKSIIGIFDLENSSQSHITRKFLEKAEKEKRIINVSEELPKSFALCEENGKIKIYISQLSTTTLLKRTAVPESNLF